MITKALGLLSMLFLMPTAQAANIATFAGGCFWCVEHAFEGRPGVGQVISGFAGGTIKNPSYEQVSAGSTHYVEAVQVHYDPKKISYEDLLTIFWHNIDPTDNGGQFVDRGAQYRSIIFYHDDTQKALAEHSKEALAKSGRFKKPIVTEIRPFTTFYPAEKYHQDYSKKNPIRYNFYYYRSGRGQFLEKAWKENAYQKPSDAELRKTLTPLQYHVTQENGTEPPFQNEYDNNKTPGIYVDIVSGEPLFSSTDKYDSKTGWPSFTKPLESKNIVENRSLTSYWTGVELKSHLAKSHLGHVFKDGPKPTGLRYCINSAALRFIPATELHGTRYEKYQSLFSSGEKR